MILTKKNYEFSIVGKFPYTSPRTCFMRLRFWLSVFRKRSSGSVAPILCQPLSKSYTFLQLRYVNHSFFSLSAYSTVAECFDWEQPSIWRGQASAVLVGPAVATWGEGAVEDPLERPLAARPAWNYHSFSARGESGWEISVRSKSEPLVEECVRVC